MASEVLVTCLVSGILSTAWPSVKRNSSDKVVMWDMEPRGRVASESCWEAFWSASRWWTVSYLGSLEWAWNLVKQLELWTGIAQGRESKNSLQLVRSVHVPIHCKA